MISAQIMTTLSTVMTLHKTTGQLYHNCQLNTLAWVKSTASYISVIGGYNKNFEVTNNVYTYEEISHKWKKTVPPMPTAKCTPGVLSLQSALVVAGGNTSRTDCTAAVEIFKPDLSQWYMTNPLPAACGSISLVAIDNACYALGGYDGSRFNSAFHAAVDDLLSKSLPTNQTTACSRSSCAARSAWKALPKHSNLWTSCS